MIEGFFGFEIFHSGMFCVGNFGKYFFVRLEDMKIRDNALEVVPVHPGRVVLRTKYNHFW